jgi:hypothetical protein
MLVGVPLTTSSCFRLALNLGKSLVLGAINQIPDSGPAGVFKGIASSVVQGMDPDPSNLKNMFKNLK